MGARLDEDGRCVITECWPDQCACPDHRGGQVINLETHGRGLASARRDTDDRNRDEWGSAPFLAKFGGTCAWCATPFQEGSHVRYDTEDALVGPCCAVIDGEPELMAMSDFDWRRSR